MGRERHHNGGDGSRRTKARHDPNPPHNYYESEEEDEIEEVPEPPKASRGGRRLGKEPAQSQYHHTLIQLLGKLHT
jgi:hypothetical protein